MNADELDAGAVQRGADALKRTIVCKAEYADGAVRAVLLAASEEIDCPRPQTYGHATCGTCGGLGKVRIVR